MSRETLQLAEALTSGKNVDIEVVFQALEFAPSTVAKKKANREYMGVYVEIDRDMGEYRTFRCWLIIANEDHIHPDVKKTIEEIQEEIPGTEIQTDEYYEEQLENGGSGRQTAQMAKQIILQRIRGAKHEQTLNEFLARKEGIVSDTVKHVERHSIIVEVVSGKLDALIPQDQVIPCESFRSDGRTRALLLWVDEIGSTGRKQVTLSRTDKNFLAKLYAMEVSEIEGESLETRAVAHDPGQWVKVVVKTNDQRIGPQGTCIGVRGSRISTVSNELSGKRTDMVLWSPETAQFVINALLPTEVIRIMVDGDKHTVDVVVTEDQFVLTVDHGGQDVRLVSDLTERQLNIITAAEADERNEAEDEAIRKLLTGRLNIDEETADILLQEGFTTLEEVVYVPATELLEIDGFDEEIMEVLRNCARGMILTLAIASEKKLEDVVDDLRSLEGLDAGVLRGLVQADIITRDDLAELAVDGLIEVTDAIEEETKRVILAAHEHWFAEGN